MHCFSSERSHLGISLSIYFDLIIRPNSPNLKAEVDEMVNKKVNEVKRLLESLSQVY